MSTKRPIRSFGRKSSLFKRLHRALIAPRMDEPDLRNREVVLNVLLTATISILTLAVMLLLVSYAVLLNTYVLSRIIAIFAVLVCFVGIYELSRQRHYRLAAGLLVVGYFILATAMVYRWGLDVPVGVLLYGLIIALSGILLGSRYSLYAAGIIIATLLGLNYGISTGNIEPDRQWIYQGSYGSDIIGFSLVFIVLAVVSWLFNYRMERSLHRALRAETALTRQKVLLEIKVEERTRELQEAQLEKMQQLYRFAEFGQFSTALLHDLANHLATLHLDFEDLEKENHSRILKHAKKSITYIEEMVQQVRGQLHGQPEAVLFDVTAEIEKVVDILQHKARKSHVTVRWDMPAGKNELRCMGDTTRFRQLVATLISNAIDAYEPSMPRGKAMREVSIVAMNNADTIIISIADWGRGIPDGIRDEIFQPFYGTKKTGMGLGLYIARQIAHDYFDGTIGVDSAAGHTVFTVTLAKAKA